MPKLRLRARRMRPSSSSIRVMTAGARRGNARRPHAGHRRARSPLAGSVGVAHCPQNRCVRCQSTSWAARPAIVQVTSSSAPHSRRRSLNRSTSTSSSSPTSTAQQWRPSSDAEEEAVGRRPVVDHEDRAALVDGDDERQARRADRRPADR